MPFDESFVNCFDSNLFETELTGYVLVLSPIEAKGRTRGNEEKGPVMS